MFILHFTATDAIPLGTESASGPARYDFQPPVAGLTKPGTEFVLREEDVRDIEVFGYDGAQGVFKVFLPDRGSKRRSAPRELARDFEEALDEGDVRLALSLVKIYFAKGMSEPFAVDYVDHVLSRTRIADRIVVAGYTDGDCTMAESVALGLRRAYTIRKTLVRGGTDVPVFAVARPKSGFAPDERYSRRVEVSAVFGGLVLEAGLGIAAGRGKAAAEELVHAHAINCSRSPIRGFKDLAMVLRSAA